MCNFFSRKKNVSTAFVLSTLNMRAQHFEDMCLWLKGCHFDNLYAQDYSIAVVVLIKV